LYFIPQTYYALWQLLNNYFTHVIYIVISRYKTQIKLIRRYAWNTLMLKSNSNAFRLETSFCQFLLIWVADFFKISICKISSLNGSKVIFSSDNSKKKSEFVNFFRIHTHTHTHTHLSLSLHLPRSNRCVYNQNRTKLRCHILFISAFFSLLFDWNLNSYILTFLMQFAPDLTNQIICLTE